MSPVEAKSPKGALRAEPSHPRGHYLAHEVGRLAGVSGNTIGQWKRRGYVRASQSGSSYPHVYSYQDVAEAMVVHELFDQGAPLRKIRGLITELRTSYGHNWPLQEAELFVAVGGHPVVRDSDAYYAVVSAKSNWHQVLDLGNLYRIASDLHNGGWAVRLVPGLKHIEVHPDRLSGTPTIRDRRIAAQDVAEIAATSSGRQVLRADYELKAAQIDDAVRWWTVVQGFQQAA